MKIALVDIDNPNKVKFPNLVLMKASTFYKNNGHEVKLIHGKLLDEYDNEYTQSRTFVNLFGNIATAGKQHSIFDPDIVIKSKIFTWSKDKQVAGRKVFFGGTGSPDITLKISDEIDRSKPDYDLYRGLYAKRSEKYEDSSIGFTTRGCPRKCDFCFVPEKEGNIKPYMNIEDFIDEKYKKLVILDNNIIAHKHGRNEIQKIIDGNYEVDFNSGFDPHIVAGNEKLAKMLAQVNYRDAVRFGCDEQADKEPLKKSIELLRKYNCRGRYFAYTIITEDVQEAYDRVQFVDSLGVIPYAQCFRDKHNTPPTLYMKLLNKWVSSAAVGAFFALSFEEYINLVLEYDPVTKHFKEVRKHSGMKLSRNMKNVSIKEIVDETIKKAVVDQNHGF